MSNPSTTLFTALFCVALIVCSCDDPELRAPVEVVVEESETVVPAEVVEPEVLEVVAKEEPPPMEKEDPPAAMKQEISGPMQPMLSVKEEGKKIVIGGIIKSPSHKDRIREQLAAAFPEFEIVDNMLVNYDCDAVSWTGRITEQLLIPYFQEVDDPGIDWLEGVITLKGSVKGANVQRDLTIMAIDAFTGTFSKDINNQLTIVNE